MGAERRRETPATRAAVLQTHLCDRARTITLPHDPKELLKDLRNYLIAAADDGRLAMKPSEVWPRLKVSDSPVGHPPEYLGIYGGEKDLKRTATKPHFVRRDGAWFVFTITVRACRDKPLELIAYDFELCFPGAAVRDGGLPRFVRFDLNQPGHENESRGLRSHLHPGHDDLSVPAPLMTPLEVLDVFVTTLLIPAHPRRA